MNIDQLTISPCSNPAFELPEVLKAYAEIGFKNFEVFTSWAKSALDINKEPAEYLKLGEKYHMSFRSFHLPNITTINGEKDLEQSILAARFAYKIGCDVVLFKADSIQTFLKFGKRFLNGIDSVDIVPVIQNHVGSAIETIEDVNDVLDGINDDNLKVLFEVGHFHAAGILWKDAIPCFKNRIKLVHIKDQIGKVSVPFGKGEIDIPGLIIFLDSIQYKDQLVVEMEVEDPENTLTYLKDSYEYLNQLMESKE